MDFWLVSLFLCSGGVPVKAASLLAMNASMWYVLGQDPSLSEEVLVTADHSLDDVGDLCDLLSANNDKSK